jgi:glycoside/pentoside/hexuronide:cation symporter, GPH family
VGVDFPAIVPSPARPAELARLPWREKLAYGAGDFASVLYWQTFMRYLPFFYTDVFGLSAGALATMLLVTRIWNGIDDPVIGLLADRTRSRWGKFRPFILFGCVPLAVAGVLTFTTPDFSPVGKLVWAYITYNVLMLLYTAVNIPYTALLGVMTNDSAERTQLSSIKFIFAFSAGMVISGTLLPLVRVLGGDAPQRGWQIAFIIYGGVAVIFFLVAGFGTRERIPPAADGDSSVWRDLKYLRNNAAWWWLTATTIAWILFIALRSSVSTHYFKYFIFNGAPDVPLTFVGHSFALDGLVSWFNTLGQAAAVLGVFLVSVVARRVAKRPLFIALFTTAILCTASYNFLQPGDLGAIFVLEVFNSLTSGPLPVLLWAMYADTADYGEWKTGRRTTGLVFSASTMSQKIGWALGAFFALKLLALVGFTANAVPSSEVQARLVQLMSVIPAGLGVIAVLLFLCYPLNDQRVAEINAELNRRRAVKAVGDLG